MKAFLLGGILSVHAQQFSFGAAGDFGTTPEFLATVDAVKAANVSFMLALGDLAYEEKEAWWCDQWRTRGALTDLVIAAGNHDVDEDCCGNLQNYIESCPRSLTVEGEPGVQYYLDYPVSNPIARLLVITPGVRGFIDSYNTYQRGDPGYVWLENSIDDARARNIRWIIVAMHKNFISTLIKTDEVGADVMALLFAKRVDLVLQGHEHGYERSKSLTCARVDVYNSSCVAESNPTLRGKGTTIVVLGTGGMALRTRNDNDPERGYFQVVDVATFGFGHFVVATDKITYNFRRSGGGTLRDSFTIRYASSSTSRAPSAPPPTSPTPFPSRAPTTPTRTTAPTRTTTPNRTITPSRIPTRQPTVPTRAAVPSRPPSSRPSRPPTLAPISPTTDNDENYTVSPSAQVQQVNKFDYDGSGIIAIISLFLIAVGLLALCGIFLIIRQSMHKKQVDIEIEEVAPAKKSVAKVAKLSKKTSEGTIDYL
jgi:hypothetical protein